MSESDSLEHAVEHHDPADPAPPRFGNGMAPGTAIKWVYLPRWHLDVKSDRGLILADGGRLATPASDEQATIIDTLADSGPAGISELALAAEVGRSYGAVTAALGVLEDGGLVEQVGGDSPQWRLTERGENHV